MTHEFGHWYGLGDLYYGENATALTMFFKSFGPCNTDKRSLGRGDVLGLRDLY